MNNITVSKSQYLEGLRCPRLFWLRRNLPELAAPVNASTEYLFGTGHLVGEYARKLFPDAILIGSGEFQPFDRVLDETQTAIESGVLCMFEPAFAAGALRCRCDVLHRSPDAPWDLGEVKMCMAVKPSHLDDVAFQAHCIQRSGQEVGRKFLIHINRDYLRSGGIDPHGLFVAQELTKEVDAEVKNVQCKVEALIELAEQREPPCTILGTKCKTLGECAFYEFCHKELPATSVYQLPYGAKTIPMLLEQGISRLEDIPTNILLSVRQGALVQSAKSKEPVIKGAAIRAFLKKIRFPVYYLDFETFAVCIPPYDGTIPYEKIPFQFSIHGQQEMGGILQHFEFLPNSPADPRRQLCDALVDILTAFGGSVLSWNASFEKSVLERMAILFPDQSTKIGAIISRIVDLILPFRNADYVDYRFKGSCSLKKVLPVLVPSLSYDCLSIRHGDDASLQFQMFVEGKMSIAEWTLIRKDLLAYCELDTLAMVEILHVLQALT